MVPEVADQGRLYAPGLAKTVVEVKTEDFLKWKPVAPSTQEVAAPARLIGLTGKARSGKDTVASMLSEGRAIASVSFAEPLKTGLKTMLQLTDEHVNGSLKEEVLDWLGKSPRQLLQTLGTDWGRSLVHTDLWLMLAKRKIESILRLSVPVIVTDVRFDNEAEMIRSLGGQVWHVYRPDAQVVNAHASEAGVSFGLDDITIYNVGTLDELREMVLEAFNEGSL